MLDTANLKASIVLKAMVKGLLKSKNDPDFTVAMGTFGHVRDYGSLCCGCCAAVALTEMFGDGKSASEMMLGYAKTRSDQPNSGYAPLSNVLQLEPSSGQDSLPINLKKFERAIDYARKGAVSSLIEFLTGELNESFDYRWHLDNQNWEECIPIVEATIAEMAAAGY